MSFGGSTEASISHEIDRVKNFIEQCLMHYMNKEEVLHVLQQQQKIEPSFIKLVWQNLEEQNPEFFKEYYLRVILKEQITKFNHLLDIHVAMVNQPNMTKVALPPLSDGSNIRPPMQPIPTDLPPSDMDNCRQSIYPGMKHTSSSDSPALLTQNSNVGMINGIINGILVDDECCYLGDLTFDDVDDSSFNYIDPNLHQLNRTLSSDLFSAYLQSLENQEENTRQPNQSTNLDFQNFGGSS